MKKRFLAVITTIGIICSVFTACSSSSKKTSLDISQSNLISDAVITTDENKSDISNLTDGESSVWSAEKQSTALEIDFKEKRTFNTIIIKEPADSVKNFSVYY